MTAIDGSASRRLTARAQAGGRLALAPGRYRIQLAEPAGDYFLPPRELTLLPNRGLPVVLVVERR